MNYCIVIPLYQNEITALIYNRNETIVIIIYIFFGSSFYDEDTKKR